MDEMTVFMRNLLASLVRNGQWAYEMSTTVAADSIGMSVATLNRWAAKGKAVPARQFGDGGARLYTVEEVVRLMRLWDESASRRGRYER